MNGGASKRFAFKFRPLTTMQKMFCVLAVGIALISCAFYALFSYVYRQNIQTIVADEMQNNISRINEYISLVFRNSNNIADIIINDSFLQGYLIDKKQISSGEGFRAFDKLIKTITYSSDIISSIDVYSTSHNMLFSSDFGAMSRLNEDTVAYYEELMSSSRLIVTTEYRDNISQMQMRNKNQITIIHPLYSLKTGDRQGFIAMNIDQISFRNILRTIEGSYNVILDRENRLVVDTLPEEHPPLFENGRFLVEPPEGKNVFYRMVEGENYIFVRSQIAYANWELVSYCSTDVLVGKGRKLREYLLTLVLVMLLLVAGTALLIINNVFRRIKVLVDSMERVRSGDFNVSVDDDQDEFSYLFTNFNAMVKHVDMLFNEIYRLELLQKDAQLNLLQAQINPHFIYNIFNNMNWLIQLERYKELELLVDAVSVYYSRSLNDGRMLITIGRMTEKLRSYVQIQQIRFRDRFDCEFDIDPEISQFEIINHTLQPIVENAISHGIEPLPDKRHVSIKGERRDGTLRFIVSDDGVGIPPARLESIREALAEKEQQSTDYFALCNVNRRIKIYYGESWGLSIDSTEGVGTTVEVVIPVPKEA